MNNITIKLQSNDPIKTGTWIGGYLANMWYKDKIVARCIVSKNIIHNFSNQQSTKDISLNRVMDCCNELYMENYDTEIIMREIHYRIMENGKKIYTSFIVVNESTTDKEINKLLRAEVWDYVERNEKSILFSADIQDALEGENYIYNMKSILDVEIIKEEK